VDERRLSLAAVVLAAGAGSRFSDEPGGKLLAEVDGESMLARVLGEVRAFGPAATVVVLGHGAAVIEEELYWSDEIRVRNHAPDQGLASSLKVGIDTLRALPDAFDGTFIVLGDQPRLRVDVMRMLEANTTATPTATTDRPTDRSAIVPRYDAPGPRNPVLLLRAAWDWVDELDGDEGLGPLISARPDLVLEVAVGGEMPDVDTADDLARLERE
jgi:CTP:molybdopterin cytidylyltransferase MocA